MRKATTPLTRADVGPHPSGSQKGGGIPMKIEVIRHYGVPFINNATAKLIATGITHHIVLIL